MVKAAVLYGDKVRLCSAHYSTWKFLLSMRDATVEDMIAQTYEIEEMIPHMFSNPEEIRIALVQNRLARQSLESKNPSPEDLDLRSKFKELNAQQLIDFKKDWPTLDVESAQVEFGVAEGEGFLEIYRFHLAETENIGASQLSGRFQESVKRIGSEISEVIMRSVLDSSTYPLFDDGAGSIVRERVEFGTMAPTAVRSSQAKQTQLAAELLARLPLFEDASMKEIIDIRRELDSSLVRFRAAIMKYSDKIRNASWDKEFSAEAEEIFHREIEPAVLDIEEAVKSNRSLLEISTRKLVDKPALATSVFSFIVSQLTALPSIAGAAMSIGVGAATAIYDALREVQEQTRVVEQNQLYFYYRAGRFLEDGTFKYSSR